MNSLSWRSWWLQAGDGDRKRFYLVTPNIDREKPALQLSPRNSTLSRRFPTLLCIFEFFGRIWFESRTLRTVWPQELYASLKLEIRSYSDRNSIWMLVMIMIMIEMKQQEKDLNHYFVKITGLSIRLLRRLRPTAPSFPKNHFWNNFTQWQISE